MVEERLINALDDCITRMAEGESVESCLQSYPDLHDDLRPMLAVGLLVRRTRYDVGVVDAARLRVSNRLSDLLGPAPLSYGVVVGLVVLALLVGVAAGGMGGRYLLQPDDIINEPPSQMAPFTPTGTISPTSTAAATQTNTLTPSPTETTVSVDRPHPTTASDQQVMVIEGPVERIEENLIMIFGITIALPPDEPVLRVIQIGDVIRVEGVIVAGEIQSTTIGVINVEVVTNEFGDVWRDSGDCTNPPPLWVLDDDAGTEWVIRCAANPAPSASDGGHGDRDTDDDGGDSDDDD